MADATPAATPAEDAQPVKGGGAAKEPARAKPKAPKTPKPGDVWYRRDGDAVYRCEAFAGGTISESRIDGPNGSLPEGVEV